MQASIVERGSIKAWHLHERQDDLWFVPPHDRVLIGLLGVREGSPTQGVQQRLTLGAGKARLLRIPRGVAHGAANLSSCPASIIYFTDNAFDPHHPDEHRLPAGNPCFRISVKKRYSTIASLHVYLL